MAGRRIGEAFVRVRPTTEGFEQEAGGKLKAGLVGVMKVVGVAAAAAFTGALAAGVSSVKAARDLGETQSAVTVIFGKSAQAVLDFGDKAGTAFGQSKKQALDAANTFATFGKSAGLSGANLVTFSTRLTGLASDLASFKNTTPQEAIEAIGAALRGESEPIRRYGVLLDEATLRQSALRLGLVKTTKEALTPQQRVLAAQAEILRQTSDAQGDFARTSGGLANQQRITAASIENLKTRIGSALLPVVTTLAVAFNTKLIPALNALWTKHGPAVANALQQGAFGVQAFFAALQGEGVTSDGFVGAMERIAVKIRAVFEAIRSGNTPEFSASLSSAADSGRKLLPVVEKFIQDMPSLNDLVRVGAVVLRFFADHADTLTKIMPLLVGAVIAFKIAQVAANAAMVLSVPVKIFEVIVNRQLVKSNRELIASRIGLTAQTVLGTGATVANTAAESTGILTRARAVASMVLHKAASLAVRGATIAWTAVQWLLNAALTANPIGLIVVAIGLLIAAIVFVATKTKFFQTVWNAAWGGVKAAAKAVADWFAGPFVNFFKGAWNFLVDTVRQAILRVITFVLAIVTAIKKLPEVFELARAAVADRLAALVEFVRGLPGRIKAALGNLGSLLVDAGKSIVEGLWNGIKSLAGWLADKVKGFIDSAVPGPVKKLLGIASPSKLFEGFGRDTIRGYARGWQAGLGELSRLSQGIVGTPVALAGAPPAAAPMNVTILADFGDGIRQVVKGVIVRSPDLVATANAQGAINVSRRG